MSSRSHKHTDLALAVNSRRRHQGGEAVELFVDDGGDPCNSGMAPEIVPPGGTVLFSTQNNVQSSFFSSSPLTAVDMFLAIGSARILTTGKGTMCVSFVADISNSPPSSIMALPMAARGKVK